MREIIIKVDGMMCGGCEKRIQNVLKSIEGVEEVVASHTEKIVKVVANVDEKILEEKIEDIGFRVI